MAVEGRYINTRIQYNTTQSNTHVSFKFEHYLLPSSFPVFTFEHLMFPLPSSFPILTLENLPLWQYGDRSFSRPLLFFDDHCLGSPAVAGQPIERVGQLEGDAGVDQSTTIVFVDEHDNDARLRRLQKFADDLREELRRCLARNLQRLTYADAYEDTTHTVLSELTCISRLVKRLVLSEFTCISGLVTRLVPYACP